VTEQHIKGGQISRALATRIVPYWQEKDDTGEERRNALRSLVEGGGGDRGWQRKLLEGDKAEKQLAEQKVKDSNHPPVCAH